jgi:hypothetical protein
MNGSAHMRHSQALAIEGHRSIEAASSAIDTPSRRRLAGLLGAAWTYRAKFRPDGSGARGGEMAAVLPDRDNTINVRLDPTASVSPPRHALIDPPRQP